MKRSELVAQCRTIPRFREEYLPHLTNKDLIIIIAENIIEKRDIVPLGKFKALAKLLH